MLKRNQDLRAAKGNIPAWMIGEKLGVHENTVYRLMRSELSDGKKKEILHVIQEIKREMKVSG